MDYIGSDTQRALIGAVIGAVLGIAAGVVVALAVGDWWDRRQ